MKIENEAEDGKVSCECEASEEDPAILCDCTQYFRGMEGELHKDTQNEIEIGSNHVEFRGLIDKIYLKDEDEWIKRFGEVSGKDEAFLEPSKPFDNKISIKTTE